MAGSKQNIRVTARTNMRDRAGRPSDEELLARVQAAADGAFGRSDTSKPAQRPSDSPVKRSKPTLTWILAIAVTVVSIAVWSWYDQTELAPKRLKARHESEKKAAQAAARNDEVVAAGPKVTKHEREGGSVWIIDVPRQSWPGGYVSWDRCIALTLAGKSAISCEGHAGSNLKFDDIEPEERDPTDIVR
jgi:hypothetical protein